MAALRVIFITTPSEEVATKLARYFLPLFSKIIVKLRAVVEHKLAACVNIVPGIKSM